MDCLYGGRLGWLWGCVSSPYPAPAGWVFAPAFSLLPIYPIPPCKLPYCPFSTSSPAHASNSSAPTALAGS